VGSESSNCDSSREVREMATNQEIIRAALALDLSYLAQSLSDKLPSVDIVELLEEYKKFLAIKVIAKDATAPIHLSPSALIDQVWHQHLLHTAQYRAACSALGVFIDHDPEGALSSDSVRKNRLLLATTHYSIIFNQPAPVKFWGLEYEPDKAAESNMKGRGGQKKRNGSNSSKAGSACPAQTSAGREGLGGQGQTRYGGERDMRLTVRSMTGDHAVVCKPSDLVKNLKARISDKIGIPLGQQRLVFAGKELEDGRALRDYSIQDGCCLLLVLRLVGC